MKYFCFFALLFLSNWAVAQNFIYKKDDTHIYGQIIDIDADKIKYITGDDAVHSERFRIKPSDVVLIFNKYGDFICFNKGSGLQTKPVLDIFIHKGQTVRNNDLVFDKTGAVTVARYIDEKGDSIIIAKGGKEAHLAKSSLVVVIKKDGSHNLYVTPNNVVPYLQSYESEDKKAQLDQMLKQPEEPAVTKVATAPKILLAQAQLPAHPSQGQPAAAVPSAKALSPTEMESLKNKGLEKIRTFENTLKIVSNPATPIPQSNKSIDIAMDLFIPASRIQISSLNSATKTVPVKYYLTSLQANPAHYGAVNVTFAQINYASNFLPNPDGSYDASVTIAQEFTATTDNQVAYHDVTNKTIVVKIKKVKKIESSGIVESWDVFLGDISVRETSPN